MKPYVILIVCMVISIGCSKGDLSPKEKPVITQNISGKVKTNEGIPLTNIEVTIIEKELEINSTKTDNNGVYIFRNLQTGNYTIEVNQPEFTYGYIRVEVGIGGVSAEDIIIRELDKLANKVEKFADIVEIKENGITLINEQDAEISTGGQSTEKKVLKAEINIPKDTEIRIDDKVVTESITVAITQMEITDIPPSSSSELPVGSVFFEPANAKFNKQVDVLIPVNFEFPPGTSIPVKKYKNGTWNHIGSAIIDDSGYSAKAQIQEFGQISVQPEVTIDISFNEPEVKLIEKSEISPNNNTITSQILNNVTFSDGIPNGFTLNYIIALIERIKGVKIGVPQELTVNLPEIKKHAKSVSVLEPYESEIWVQECILTKLELTSSELIDLTINLENTVQSHSIRYSFTTNKLDTECFTEWVEHNQGNFY